MVFLIGHSWCPHVNYSWCPHVAGHRTPQVYDGTKMSIKKTPRIKMIVASEHQAKLRQKEIQEIDKKASKEHEEAKKNSNFLRHTQRAGNALEKLVRDRRVLPL